MPDADALQPRTIQRLPGLRHSRVALLAGMELDLFTPLAAEALTPAELATRLGVDANRLSRLLYALAATGLLEARDGHFHAGPEAAEFLVSGRPRSMVGSHELLVSIWSANLHTAESIRTAAPAAAHDWSQADPGHTAASLRGRRRSRAPSAARLGTGSTSPGRARSSTSAAVPERFSSA